MIAIDFLIGDTHLPHYNTEWVCCALHWVAHVCSTFIIAIFFTDNNLFIVGKNKLWVPNYFRHCLCYWYYRVGLCERALYYHLQSVPKRAFVYALCISRNEKWKERVSLIIVCLLLITSVHHVCESIMKPKKYMCRTISFSFFCSVKSTQIAEWKQYGKKRLQRENTFFIRETWTTN